MTTAESLMTRYTGLPGVPRWWLQVAVIADITPRLRRISLTGPELDRFEFQAGQDMMFVFPRGEDETVRRRYTIRQFDRVNRMIDLDFVLHGNGPAVTWATTVQPGDYVLVVGPRGSITLDAEADWHLFVGDETSIPGALAMMEELSPAIPAIALLSVTGPEDELPVENEGETRRVVWLHGGEDPRARIPQMVEALRAVELPEGRGRVYIAGEVMQVAALKKAALERVPAQQVTFKPYWSLGKANAQHGEPEKQEL